MATKTEEPPISETSLKTATLNKTQINAKNDQKEENQKASRPPMLFKEGSFTAASLSIPRMHHGTDHSINMTADADGLRPGDLVASMSSFNTTEFSWQSSTEKSARESGISELSWQSSSTEKTARGSGMSELTHIREENNP
uniref:Uncharacterized protein n=1 Tax=Helicotheca tamesis TaxID=374047 RepID=A0A7S2N0H2_9STRA|mmetsp:Transcript_7040/g.9530  ORF Transcript_7040/g.9530 Transcript_7040/m.9530 type:complete len:141 (+) Transcript_7040:85-507(+)